MFLLSAFNRRFRSLPGNTQGWLICAAVLVQTVLRSGVTYSFGLFVAKLEFQHNQTMAVQNWIGTLSFTICLTTSPISVLITRSMGHNGYQIAAIIGVFIVALSFFLSSVVALVNELWMFLTFSVVYGLGCSLSDMSSSLLLVEHFDKDHRYHVMATSALQCGYPVGSLLFNPIYGWLIESYGVSVALIVAGCLMLLICLPCCLPFVSKLDADTNEPIDYGDYKKRMNSCCNPKQFLVRPEIFLWLLGNLMIFIGYYMPFANLAYYMKLKHMDISQSKWAVTILSVSECITYVIASPIGDYLKGKLVFVNIISSVGLAILCFVWPFIDTSYTYIMIISVFFGSFLGLTLVYQFAASGEVTKLPIDIAWAATSFWFGLGTLVGPLFSGVVYDIRHRDSDVWFVCGGLYIIQILIFTAIPVIWRCRVGSFVPDDYTEIMEGEEDGILKDRPLGYSLNAVEPNRTGNWPIDSQAEDFEETAESSFQSLQKSRSNSIHDHNSDIEEAELKTN